MCQEWEEEAYLWWFKRGIIRRLRKTAPTEYTKDDIPHALTQIGRLSDGVKAEFDLVGLRMSWLVLSESFMFAAFAVSVVNHKQPPVSSFAAADSIILLPEVILYLIHFLPIFGMLMVLCTYVAILAAHSAVRKLKLQRDEMMARLPTRLQIDLISVKHHQHWLGNVPPLAIPFLLFLIWFGAWVKVCKFI